MVSDRGFATLPGLQTVNSKEMLVHVGSSDATLSLNELDDEFQSPLATKELLSPKNMDALSPCNATLPSCRPTARLLSKVMMTEDSFAGRGTFCTIVTEIVLLHPGSAELWLISFLVKTELGWLHDKGAGVVVVVAIGVVLEVVVGCGVVVLLLDEVGAGVVVVLDDVVGAGVVLEDVVGAGVVVVVEELDVVGAGVVVVVATVVLEEDVGATVVVLLDVVGACVVLEDVVGSEVVLDEVVASMLVVVEVVAPQTGPITCPGSVCTEPPHDEHDMRSIGTRAKQK